MSTLLKTSFAVLLCATAAISAKAQGVVNPRVVYQSEVYYSGGFYAAVGVGRGVETGDQVNLDGTERVMTEFSFGYVASGLDAGATAQVAFYDANGVPADTSSSINKTTTPLLWQTLPLSVHDTTSGTFRMLNYYEADGSLNNGLNVLVPDNLIWTVKFNYSSGFASLLAGNSKVGGGYAQFLTDNGTAWQLQDVVGAPGGGAYFAATITAVPEPSTFALLGLGGFASMVLIRRRK